MAETGRTDEGLSYPTTPLWGSAHAAVDDETLKLSTLSLDSASRGIPAALDTPPETPLDDDVGSSAEKGKGKERVLSPDLEPSTPSHLTALPAELAANILQYLGPIDLANIAQTCRILYTYAADERLWKAHVQENVPGEHLTTPFPFQTFQELYAARDPHWFLPKYKFWFADCGLPGRLMVVQYDQRRGMIEGFQVLASNKNTSFHTWHAHGNTIISGFSPAVKVYLDNPILRLPVVPGTTSHRVRADENDGGSPTTSSSGWPQASYSRFECDFYMHTADLSGLQSSFAFAKSLTPDEIAERLNPPFPYRNLWPPRSIPSAQRVLGAGLDRPSSVLSHRDRPETRGQVCERAFRIHKWLPVQSPSHPRAFPQFPQSAGPWDPFVDTSHYTIAGGSTAGNSMAHLFWNNVNSIMRNRFDYIANTSNLGEEVSTYSTLDPQLYTPTEAKPFRGIWVGDYGLHGPEFLWIHQPDDEDQFIPPARFDGESDEDYANRERDAATYRGRLEAIKLTGDVNIPRGEPTFIAKDLGQQGLARIETHQPFEGVRVVHSECHIADHGFANARYIPGELFLISHDKLAHHWIELSHISHFYRVDIDSLLIPRSATPAK